MIKQIHCIIHFMQHNFVFQLTFYSLRFTFQIYSKYAPDTEAILILIQFLNSDKVRIRSRHGCHPDTYSIFKVMIQFRYAPDTEAILLLIQIQLQDTVQIRSIHGCYSISHSDCKFKIQLKYVPDADTILILFF